MPFSGRFLFELVSTKSADVNHPKSVTNFQSGFGVHWCGLGGKNRSRGALRVLIGVFDS